jgi:hypothetical protein
MESTARVTGPEFASNFYYTQEDLLFEFCQVHFPGVNLSLLPIATLSRRRAYSISTSFLFAANPILSTETLRFSAM